MAAARTTHEPKQDLTDAQYRSLLALRDGLRRFLHWSADRAEEIDMTPSHHQLLLVVRGHDDPRGPAIGDVADHLLLRHHSAVELVARAEAEGLIRRRKDPDDQRTTRLALTAEGRDRLARLSSAHLEELARMRGPFEALWRGLEP